MFAALSLLLTLVSSSLVHCQGLDGMGAAAEAMVNLMATVADILNLNVGVDLSVGGGGCGEEDYVNCYRVETIDRNLNDVSLSFDKIKSNKLCWLFLEQYLKLFEQ